MRVRKAHLILSIAAVFVSFAASFLVVDTAHAAPMRCYWVASKSPSAEIEQLPECSRQWLADNGFQLSGIPDPPPEDTCYLWPYDPEEPAKAVTNECDKTPYSNAKDLGTSTDVGIGTCNGQIPLGEDCTQEEADDIAEKAAASDTAAAAQADASKIVTTEYTGNPEFKCGDAKDDSNEVYPSFYIGCKGEGNAIVDMLFAFIRILSGGIGLALIGSIMYAGFEYATASGDPNKTGLAKKRLVSTLLVALPIYLLTYAILNWLIPMAIF